MLAIFDLNFDLDSFIIASYLIVGSFLDLAILIDYWLILYLSYIAALGLISFVIMARAKCNNFFEFFDNLE